MNCSFLVSYHLLHYCPERSRLPHCICPLRSEAHLVAGREAGIHHQEQHLVGECHRGSTRGSREYRWKWSPVRHRFEYRSRHSATHNDCDSADCSASARSDSGARSIATSDSPVRQTGIRPTTARPSSRSVSEKLVVASSSPWPIQSHRFHQRAMTIRRTVGTTSSPRRCS